ncbi:MAG: hypothetical protein U5N10_04710 [Gemmobacter sp.]|nr:hypothetical protein [Gemmobacter sp.]
MNNIHLKKIHLKYEDELTLRVIFSYQENHFSKQAPPPPPPPPPEKKSKKFLNSTYLVTNDFNRMACKLSGEAIKCDINGIISEGIAFGSIQIPSDGQPIVLLKDRQTIGGYPKIGVVLSIDCFKLSQARANTKIRFEEISYIKKQFKS